MEQVSVLAPGPSVLARDSVRPVAVEVDGIPPFELHFLHITSWADAHANLPSGARWSAKSDVAP